MPKHHTEDYKLSAVKYYLKYNISMNKTCEMFDCSYKSIFSTYFLILESIAKFHFFFQTVRSRFMR